MPPRYIFALQETSRLQNTGNKAKNLHFLARRGFPIPVTHVCTWDAHTRYLQDGAQILEHLKVELSARLDASKLYAVRSSASVEDSRESSFAGQFATVLDIQGVDEIVRAIRSIWDEAGGPVAQTYFAQSGAAARDLRMAVVIQEMILPEISGVSFSKNPVTGLDEVLVEAVRGSGAALVQDGVTPARWINKWGTWIAMPDQSHADQGIELELVEAVVSHTKQIAKVYGRPVDLEWVYDGSEIRWVQMREITSLDIPIYSNRISKEVFPGIIKPLIWSVNVPLVNGAWVDLLTELIGPNDIEPEELAGYFYSRAYFNMGTLGLIFERMGLPRETLELLMGIEVEGPERPSFKPSPSSYALMPRMLRFGLDKTRFARRVGVFLPAMHREFRTFREGRLAELDEWQLLEQIDRLYPLSQETAYYNIVTPLLMQVYSRGLKSQLSRMGVDFESFDLTGDMPELEPFEPNLHLGRLHKLYSNLDSDLQARIQESSYEQFSLLPGAGPLQQGIAQFLERFGHLSDSGNDFSHAPWRENPDLILQMVTHYTPAQGGVADRIKFADLPVSALRRSLLKPIYKRARQFQWYREAVSSLYTFGYGLFRDHFLALGERLVHRSIIADREDIFYLYMHEVRELVEGGHLAHDYQALVARRKDEIDRVRDIAPPDLIYGDQAPPLDPGRGARLKGIPTSRGHYTGPARILQGIQDMDKLREGDVLVIPYSDVGWTPLFTRAGAVIAESGGILSHSSIIAREYGIPAVVSVPGACQLADGELVTVNGYRGEITVHEPAQCS